jgi:hypothetical protein
VDGAAPGADAALQFSEVYQVESDFETKVATVFNERIARASKLPIELSG